MRYYNLERNHVLNGDLSPTQFEQMTEKKVCGLTWPEHRGMVRQHYKKTVCYRSNCLMRQNLKPCLPVTSTSRTLY
ncbi:hypothetical protein [Hafnia alvei]|uniref:hypothetical protein n=1 Tax=Hafnia alvei TaxID=569 RepID=UPI0009B9B223